MMFKSTRKMNLKLQKSVSCKLASWPTQSLRSQVSSLKAGDEVMCPSLPNHCSMKLTAEWK